MNKEDFKNLIKNNMDALKSKEKSAINQISEKLQDSCNKPDDKEEFKFSCYVGSWRKYAYFMGNKNHMLVVEKKENENFCDIKDKEFSYQEIKQYNHEVLKLEKGYIKTKFSSKFEYVEYSTDTDVYKYVEMAGWLTDEDYENAILLDENDRIEVHHLNGDSSDNSVSNLVYIPKSIHCFVHSKNLPNP